MIDTFACKDSLAKPAYVRVGERLREEILSGVFSPGTHLKIAELSKRYGLSQMPVREALQTLQGEGLIIIEANRGAKVRTVNERFIRNIYDVRAAIDVMLVRRCIERIETGDVFRLFSIETRFENAVTSGRIDRMLRINENLHQAIYRVADNPEAFASVERYWGLIRSLRMRYEYGPKRISTIVSEHRQLLHSIEARDFAQAERTAWHHSQGAMEDLVSQWSTVESPEPSVARQ